MSQTFDIFRCLFIKNMYIRYTIDDVRDCKTCRRNSRKALFKANTCMTKCSTKHNIGTHVVTSHKELLFKPHDADIGLTNVLLTIKDLYNVKHYFVKTNNDVSSDADGFGINTWTILSWDEELCKSKNRGSRN